MDSKAKSLRMCWKKARAVFTRESDQSRFLIAVRDGFRPCTVWLSRAPLAAPTIKSLSFDEPGARLPFALTSSGFSLVPTTESFLL